MFLRHPVRPVSVILAVSAALIMGVATLPTAQAVPATPDALTMDPQCTKFEQSNALAVTVTGAVGDTFTIQKGTGGSGCSFKTLVVAGASGLVTPSVATIFVSATTFTIVSSGTFEITADFGGNFSVTVVTSSASPASPAAVMPADVMPADVMQGVETPADGSCGSVVRPDLDWAGVAAGGWSRSWAPWANGGRGDVACTRTLWLDPNVGRWTSRAR